MENILITSYSHRQAGRPPSTHSYVVFQGIKRKDVGAVLNPHLRTYWPIYETAQAYPCLVLKKRAEKDVDWGSLSITLDLKRADTPRVVLPCLHTGYEKSVEGVDGFLKDRLKSVLHGDSQNSGGMQTEPLISKVTLKPWSIRIEGTQNLEMFWLPEKMNSDHSRFEVGSLPAHVQLLWWLRVSEPAGLGRGESELTTILNELLTCAQNLTRAHAENSIHMKQHQELNSIFRPVLDSVLDLTKKYFQEYQVTGDYLDGIHSPLELQLLLPTASELEMGGNKAYDKRPHLVKFWTCLHENDVNEWFRRFYSQEERDADLVLSLLAFKPQAEQDPEEEGQEEQEDDDHTDIKVKDDCLAKWLRVQTNFGSNLLYAVEGAFGRKRLNNLLESLKPSNYHLSHQKSSPGALGSILDPGFWTALKHAIYSQYEHESLVFTQHGELLHKSKHLSICRKFEHFYLIAAHQEVFVWDTQTKSKSVAPLPVEGHEHTSITSFLVSNALGYIEATLAAADKSDNDSDEDEGAANSVVQTFFRGFLPSLRSKGKIVFRRYRYTDSKKGSIWAGRNWALSFRTHEGKYGYLFKLLQARVEDPSKSLDSSDEKSAEGQPEKPDVFFYKFPEDPNKDLRPELCRGMIATVYWMRGHFMVLLQCKGSAYCVIDLFREISALSPPERRETVAIENFYQVAYREGSSEAQSNCCAFIKKGYGVILRIFDDFKYSIFLLDLKNWNRIYHDTQRTISRNLRTAPVSVSQSIIDNAFRQKSGYTIRYHEDCGSKGVQIFTRWGYLSNPGCDQLWYNKYLFIP